MLMEDESGEDWPPPPPSSREAKPHGSQRAYYSEMLSYGLRREDLLSESKFAVAEAKTLPEPLAQSVVSDLQLFDLARMGLPAMKLSQTVFDDRAIEPKVVTAYVPKPGGMPRKLEIERRKRLYAEQDLPALLLAKGIDYSTPYASTLDNKPDEQKEDPAPLDAPLDAYEALPLVAFDNTEFEVLSPSEWLATGLDASGAQRGIPARVLKLSDPIREVGEWCEARVVGWDNEQYSVEWADGSSSMTHRIHCCFVAEDPCFFVERVAEAHARRSVAEAVLLQNLYVDCMPTEGTKPLDSELCGRILALALNTKLLRQQTLETSTIIFEVNADYTRTLNKIVFDATHARAAAEQQQSNEGQVVTAGSSSELLAGVKRILPEEAAEPKCHLLPLENTFGTAYSEFRFHSCLTRLEIIKIVVNVKAECLKIAGLSFFNFLTKSVRVDEFANAQYEASSTVASRLRESWPSSVVGHVRQQLKEVKKGWFNLDESNNEVYAFSKLRKFLRFLNFVMQDTMRFVVEASIKSYAAYLIKSCDCVVEARSPKDVTNTYANKTKRSLPLFVVELVELQPGPEATFGYLQDLKLFETTALKYFDEAILLTQSIVQVERRVMTKLFWSHDPVMISVHPTEQWVLDLREQLEGHLAEARGPLERYVETYADLIPFLRLNIEDYVNDVAVKFGGPDPKEAVPPADFLTPAPPVEKTADDVKPQVLDVAALQKVAEEHFEKQRELKSLIPEQSISVGCFAVSAKSLGRLLSEKHETIGKKILGIAASRTTFKAEQSTVEFGMILTQLSVTPTNIEELTGLRAYMESVPSIFEETGRAQQVIDSCMANYGVLEDIHYKLSAADFKLRWEVYGWPKKLGDKCVELEEKCVKLEKQYETDMVEAQEEFAEKLRGLAEEIDHLKDFHDLKLVDQVAAHVRRIKADLEKADEESRLFNSRELLHGKETTEYSQLKDIAKAFEPYGTMWSNIDLWQKSSKEWMTDSFVTLDADQMETDTTNIFRALNKCDKTFGQSSGLEGCLGVVRTVLTQVADFRPHVPLVTALRQAGMRDRHWDSLSTKLGRDVKPDAEYTLQTIFDLKLHENVEMITKISEVAGKEFSIETSLDKMQQAWADVVLQVEPYRETGTSILRGVDEYMALLDEHVTTTQAMTFSAFKGPFEDRIDKWNSSLLVVSELIDEWIAVQKNWLYLQPIFDSADINKQLPVEGKRFSTVDKHWRQTLNLASSPGTLAIMFCNDPKLLERFRESNKLLDMVQKGLSDYLETKRAGFARFYFLSDGDLLEILSETKDPKMVQPHLRKCFEGIKSLDFHPDDLTISSMMSPEKEVVPFVALVDPKNKNIEDWMVEINVAMCSAVRDHMIRAVRSYPTAVRTEWMCSWPGQVVLNGSQVHWTLEVESVLAKKGNAGIREYYEQSVMQLADMVLLIRTQLSNAQRTTVGALAVIDVHARDVVKHLADSGVAATSDFDWQSQMRFYWEEEEEEQGGGPDNGDLWVIQVESKRSYGYEYLGNSFRLVITPLTDKCYLTLMGALQMILGGAPAGPAGTGKTETTKDLAKALAKQCVVFNCSDGLDYRAMGKFFKGLASAGAWACFDEFNRINIEVLSVIAQQIMTLQAAVQRGEDRIIFEDTDIKVDPEFAVYITMNPGYAGRSSLPDNLEALFRPVAMMVPDYALIGEIMLFSFGYMEGRKCAKKMVATFRLCSEQLSSQDHYDYGMRAVKTVITAAGNLKRAAPEENEEALLLRALQDVNVPKFLAHDLPLFAGILSDLFPGVERPPFDYGPLLSALKAAIKEQNLQAVPIFLRKNIELYEMICVRHGLMVVGPTGGGKSANIRTLQKALTSLKNQNIEGDRYEKVQVHHLNPKSISMGQLYGMFDQNTHEWQDGILAALCRQCIKNTKPDLQWILFDGPVDAIWIENMNTVLDDNKKLCLTSGEIMSLSEPMTMMFEPEDLAVASPATVSRCGMIYMEPKSLGSDPIVQSWLAKLPEPLTTQNDKCKVALQALFDTFYGPAVALLRKPGAGCCAEPFPTVDGALLDSLLNLIDCALEGFQPKEGVEPPPQEAIEAMENGQIEAIFIFAFVWSVCATGDTRTRRVFDRWLRSFLESRGGNSSFKSLKKNYAFPEEGLVYDYAFSVEEDRWVPWMQTVPAYEFDPNSSTYSELIIPTMDSVRYTYLLDTLVTNNKHVLMSGPTGTGKTVNISRHLQTGLPERYVPICITFSAQTSANQTQDLLDSKCEKRRKGIFGPSAGKKFCVFVDDVNMPTKEEYGAQPPLELLRQWFDSSGWFDRKALTFRTIIDVIWVCACGPPGGGRNHISARFPRHFNTIGYTPMQDESMQLIYRTILGNFMGKQQKFKEEVLNLAPGVVDATIAIYNTILSDLRPTPAKSHYQFNLRDVSKVFQGILMVTSRSCPEPEDFARLFVHENNRVFADRLINQFDHEWFDSLVDTVTRKNLGDSYAEAVNKEVIVFGDYMIPGADPRVYEEVKDRLALQPAIEEYLAEFNSDTKQPMHLVMFFDAIQHVSRISRVIRQPKGNVLLLGVGGSGRQSLTKLATFMADYKLFQIEIAKGYGMNEWRENLREVLLLAGIKRQPVVFLFSDTQIVMESMLEDLNNVLNTGDVPNLYGPEDMDSILTTCKQDCVRKRIQPTKLNIFAQFISRVMDNIHMVLCMSPLGEAFRTRLRKFPSIVNCCTIDWFAEWPEEALQSVATRSLTENNASGVDTLNLGEHLQTVVEFVKHAHISVARKSEAFKTQLNRYNYVTPTSYLELLSTYKAVIGLKRKEVGTLKSRLQTGLDKLISTATQVEGLQVQLTEMQPQLIKTQGEVEVMIVNIDIDKKSAAETQTTVAAEEAAARNKEAETQAIADDAQRDLDEALPALDEAVKSLSSLKKSDIDEVKTMGKPPFGVKLTMEACCILFAIKPEMDKDPTNPGKKILNYFKAAQKELLSLGQKLIDKMKTFDKDNIPHKIILQIEPYIAMDEFQPEIIKKASSACTAMCMWVRAMHKYHQVTVMVEPKKKLLAEASESLGVTRASLAIAQTKLRAVMDKIAELEADFTFNNDKKNQLVRDVDECSARLLRAKKLIGGLGGERTRWTESCTKLEADYEALLGDCLVSSAMIAYSGPFTPSFRRELTKDWQDQLAVLNVPHSPNCEIRQTLADPVAIRQWTICALPQDGHSVENGIIISKARRFPLLIDPQGQANRFIKNMGNDPNFAENGIEVTKLSEKNFLRTLENGVRFGRWVLIENIGEKLDAALEPLLLQQKFVQGGTEMIKIGDSTIPWNSSFRFYMTTKLTNPHYAPEVCVKVSLLNFAITPVGLEDQLLGVVVVEERPDMEERKNSLVIANASMKKELKEIEDTILYKLSNSTGNILDDHELIDTLASSKQTSEEIQVKVAEAESTEKEIDASRERYRPVAFRATTLYFSICGLSAVDPMYQYSLQWFTALFISAIRQAEKSSEEAGGLEQRLKILDDFFTYYVYTNVCRSLFEKDKLLLSFLLTIRILDGAGEVDPHEWRFLITGKGPIGEQTDEPLLENPAPVPTGWIDARVWSEILQVSGLERFKGLEEDFIADVEAWRTYYDATEPDKMPLPSAKWEAKLSSFQKLCVLRCIRADRVPDGIMAYCIEKLGQRFVEPPPFNLPACYADSTNLTPLVFVLSKGSDPTKAFNEFCREMRFERKVKKLSLGQGQGGKATAMIEEAANKGTWAYLQNCHLFISWLVELERLCDALTVEATHKDFRLWLTSMPSEKFPVSILQNGVKMTNEPPKGLKANLKSVYFKLDDAKLQATSKPAEYRKLLFALVFFHASCQERRKFGALGWNVPYEFNETDLDISRGQLEMFLDSYDEVPFRVLCFLTSYINYGGRVTDYIDIRTIDVIIKSFYHSGIFEPNNAFDPQGTYLSIEPDPERPHASYMDYIETLPLTAGPSIFGMHENANIACAFNETFSIFETLNLLEQGGGGGGDAAGGSSRDELVACEVESIHARIAEKGLFDIDAIGMQYPVVYEESMNTVLAQECIRYNKLVGEMLDSLPQLAKALQGLVVMSHELERMGDSIAVAAVPAAWEAKAYPSLKPLGAWADDLVERLDFIHSWINDGIPVTFWISGFYFPQAFLTGSMQNYARANQLPIDTIAFDYIMLETFTADTITEKPADGVYIRGLFMEGARWDPAIKSINDSKPKQLYSPAPLMHLKPIKDRVGPTGGIYRCPIYKTLSRRGVLSTTGHSTNFVMWIEMPSNRKDEINNDGLVDQLCWCKAGVAAFCSLKF